MVMTGVALLVVLGIGYIWLTRGFFSSLIHLICTLIAGAIAFAAWEPVSLMIMGFADSGGFTSFLSGVAWSLGLAIPFAISLTLLRVGVDKLLPANVSPGAIADYVGGGVCGVLSGVISAGILVISLGYLRMETTFFGATHLAYSNDGNIVRDSPLFVPLDKYTVMFYGRLSEAAFRTDQPLARWHPNMHEEGSALRINFADGKARNTTKLEDFDVESRFTVGEAGNVKLGDLLKDGFNNVPQPVTDVDGSPYPEGSHIEGVIVNFKAGAKEKEGKITIGNGQIRMLLESTDGTQRMDVFPIAVSSQAESKQPGFGRWRYDARDTFIASVGAAAQARFMFEFVSPPNFKPIALYIKGTRVRLDEGALAQPKDKLAGASARDQLIVRIGGGSLPTPGGGGTDGGGAAAGGAPTSGGATDLDTKDAVTLGSGQAPGPNQAVTPPTGVTINSAIGFTIQKGTHDPMVLDESGKETLLVEGTKAFEADYADKTRGLERALRVEKFSVPADVVIVKIDVSGTSKLSILGKAAQMAGDISPPLLYDTNGTAYQPVGYIYSDSTKTEIRYTPGQPIRALSEAPRLSASRPDQKLTLVFQCNFGVTLSRFAIGKKVLVNFDPPLPLQQRQGGM